MCSLSQEQCVVAITQSCPHSSVFFRPARRSDRRADYSPDFRRFHYSFAAGSFASRSFAKESFANGVVGIDDPENAAAVIGGCLCLEVVILSVSNPAQDDPARRLDTRRMLSTIAHVAGVGTSCARERYNGEYAG